MRGRWRRTSNPPPSGDLRLPSDPLNPARLGKPRLRLWPRALKRAAGDRVELTMWHITLPGRRARCRTVAVLWLLGVGVAPAGELSFDEAQRLALAAAPMLRAAAALAGRYGIPGQLCVEEHMACAVGGCAGCVVPVHTAGGVALRRVCVDGPVFAAAQLHPELYTRAADASAH
jgi:hypothetical protein